MLYYECYTVSYSIIIILMLLDNKFLYYCYYYAEELRRKWSDPFMVAMTQRNLLQTNNDNGIIMQNQFLHFVINRILKLDL